MQRTSLRTTTGGPIWAREWIRLRAFDGGELRLWEYHLQFAADADLITQSDFRARQEEIIEVRRMLSGLLRRLRSKALE